LASSRSLSGLHPLCLRNTLAVASMKVVLPMLTALLRNPCQALQPVTSEREEPCASTVDVSISHGSVLRRNKSSSALLSNMSDTNDMTLSIFWTGGPGWHAQDVIDEQVLALRASNLLDRVTAIYVWGQDYDRQDNMSGRTHAELFAKHGDVQEKIQEILADDFWDRQGHTYEFPTLEGLWNFCRAEYMRARAPNNFVLYMHSKGSTKYKREWNEDSKWRRTMQQFVLHRYTDCVEHLRNGFSTCGALLEKRSEGATWPHYRGNFWWARCDYIKQLQDPRPQDYQLYNRGNPFKPKPSGRFLSEWWLLGSNALDATLETSHKNCWGQPSQFTQYGSIYDRASAQSCASFYRVSDRCA